MLSVTEVAAFVTSASPSRILATNRVKVIYRREENPHQESKEDASLKVKGSKSGSRQRIFYRKIYAMVDWFNYPVVEVLNYIRVSCLIVSCA